jgi:V/A-type H+-transporting ATPase subunit F
MKIFAIGDDETVLGFRLIGIDGVAVDDAESTSKTLRSALSRKDIGIVLITEKAADTVRDEVDSRVFASGLPLVLEIPDSSGAAPSRATIEEIVRKAIGIGL